MKTKILNDLIFKNQVYYIDESYSAIKFLKIVEKKGRRIIATSFFNDNNEFSFTQRVDKSFYTKSGLRLGIITLDAVNSSYSNVLNLIKTQYIKTVQKQLNIVYITYKSHMFFENNTKELKNTKADDYVLFNNCGCKEVKEIQKVDFNRLNELNLNYTIVKKDDLINPLHCEEVYEFLAFYLSFLLIKKADSKFDISILQHYLNDSIEIYQILIKNDFCGQIQK